VKVSHLTSTGGRKLDSTGCAHKSVPPVSRVVKAYPHPRRHACTRASSLTHRIVEKLGPRHEFIYQDVGDEIGCTGVVLVDR